MRTKYLDPDFRRKPKTDLFCCVCYKDLDDRHHTHSVITVNGGTDAVHPMDYRLGAFDDAKVEAIGNDCRRRIGAEWTLPHDDAVDLLSGILVPLDETGTP